MKLEVLATNLNQGLSIVSRSVANRVQLPILSNILLTAGKQGLELVSTDLEISFRVQLGARVTEPGQVTVPAKILTELATTLGSNTVSLELDADTLKLVAGNIKACLPTMAADEFPVVPRTEKKPDLNLDAAKLVPALTRTVIAASRDDSRPVYTGMLWRFIDSGLVLAATDGYRLSYSRLSLTNALKIKDRADLIIPARALQELSRVISKPAESAAKDSEATVAFKIDREQQQVIFKFGEVELISRLLGGDFPAFEQIIPQEFSTKIQLGQAELTEAVRRANIFARDAANIVKLKTGDNQVEVSASSSQVGSNQTVIDAQVEGEGLEMAFNGRYLLDYLAICPEDQFVLETSGGLKPGVFKSDSFGFFHIIMPVRVQS